jgi:hypothetical protein
MARKVKIAVNDSSIRKKVKVAKGTINAARKDAQRALRKAKKSYMDAFDDHPITKELSAGISASNSSGTLGGYGNLRTFMGFSYNPITKLRSILKTGFAVKKEMPTKKKDGVRTFVFSYPDKNYLEAHTTSLKLEFETGRNWVLAIERGISGFSNYMYKKFRGGRSGKGLQSGSTINRGTSSFKATPYRSVFEQAFKDGIKKFK